MAQKVSSKSKPKTTKKTASVATQTVAANKAGKTTRRNLQLPALHIWNLWLAVVFALQAAALLLYGSVKAYPLTMQYLAPDALATEANGHQVLATATRHIVDVRLSWLLAALLLILALANLAVATAARKQYDNSLARGMHVRWLGLGVGGGLLLATVALASGISQLGTLLFVVLVTALGAAAVPLADQLNQEKKGWLPHIVCGGIVVATALPLVLFALVALGALLWGGKIPGQLYATYASVLVLYVAWAWAAHQRVMRKGRWADALFAERVYIALGFVTATAIAWLLATGTV